jgi:hypothetical protein
MFSLFIHQLFILIGHYWHSYWHSPDCEFVHLGTPRGIWVHVDILDQQLGPLLLPTTFPQPFEFCPIRDGLRRVKMMMRWRTAAAAAAGGGFWCG